MDPFTETRAPTPPRALTGLLPMRLLIAIAAIVAALLAAAVPGTAQTKPPTVVVPPAASDGMAAPPPSPTLQLKRGGHLTRTLLERWSRPRPDGNGFSGAIVKPPITVRGMPGHPADTRLPRLFAKPGSNLIVDTHLDATSVRLHLLSTPSTHARVLRVHGLDAQRWQFSMPGHRRVVVRISATYADGGDSRSRAELRRTPPPTT
ncbi:MAG TPA: hypothetical protein VHH12_07740 [Mycobacterium sp.]|nr:hypothetical protein [Mycobacterium sp.]